MTTSVSIILLVFAFVLAVLAALWQGQVGRLNLLAAAIACWIAAELFGRALH